jgi:hypothetical protein
MVMELAFSIDRDGLVEDTHAVVYKQWASVASFQAALLAEIYLCNVCSCQKISRRNGRG